MMEKPTEFHGSIIKKNHRATLFALQMKNKWRFLADFKKVSNIIKPTKISIDLQTSLE